VYETLSKLAQTGGLLLFVAAFGMVLYYALSPANRAGFDRASRLPLDESDHDDD